MREHFIFYKNPLIIMKIKLRVSRRELYMPEQLAFSLFAPDVSFVIKRDKAFHVYISVSVIF